MSALTALMTQIRTLSLEDQRALNAMLVANIRAGLKQKAVMTSIQFKAGDVVKFDGKTRGPIFIKIHSFSRDLTKVKGVQLNPARCPVDRWCQRLPRLDRRRSRSEQVLS